MRVVYVKRLGDRWVTSEAGQERTAAKTLAMLRRKVARGFGVPEEKVRLSVTPFTKAEPEIRIMAKRQLALEASRRIVDARRADLSRAIQALQAEGVHLRDVAYLLGVSHQRVHKLLEDSTGTR